MEATPPLGQETRAMCDSRDLLQTSPLPPFLETNSGGAGVGWVIESPETPQKVSKYYLCYCFCPRTTIPVVRGLRNKACSMSRKTTVISGVPLADVTCAQPQPWRRISVKRFCLNIICIYTYKTTRHKEFKKRRRRKQTLVWGHGSMAENLSCVQQRKIWKARCQIPPFSVLQVGV